ncbi:MAG TPA: glycosyltransferase family 4 protein, partial [Flavisolibacter sp.]|nr:glycosyltransferase family 4 protein [Flavisolibacter sp.]
MYKLLIAKRRFESLIMSPFVMLGKLWAVLDRQKEDFDIYFFFPFYHIGGAEKVHYQITQAFVGKKCIIYFTRKSKGENFLEEFKKAGFVIKDISRFTDNKFIYPFNFIFRGILSYKINHNKSRALVFNGQSNFGYKVSPWISARIPQVDLIHALSSFSKIRIPFLEFYRISVTVSQEIIDKHEHLYQKKGVPQKIRNNIHYINYGIELPERTGKTNFGRDVKLLYVGRGSEEKRIYLVARMAEAMHNLGNDLQFSFLGDVDKYVPQDLRKYCRFYGTITDQNSVDSIYREHNILLVTSYTESGPLVVMEAMARGLCIISTPVGIVNEHILPDRNGFVFSSIENETLIVEEAIGYINKFAADITLQKA